MKLRRLLWLSPLLALVGCADVSIAPAPDATDGTGGGVTTCEKGTACDPEPLVCEDGWADCNGEAWDGCEAHLSTDADACGACGVSCGAWGDCFQSQCVEILATQQAALVGADSLVTASDALYWASPGIDLVGQVASVPLAGGPVSSLAPAMFPERMHLAGSVLVWDDVVLGSVQRMDLSSRTVETLVDGAGSVLRVLDVGGDTVFFTSGSDVRSVPLSGGTPLTLATGFTEVSAARLDGGALFVLDLGPEGSVEQNGLDFPARTEGTLSRLDVGTSAVSLLASGLDMPTAIQVADGALYWAESGSLATYFVEGVDVNGGTRGRVVRAQLDGAGRTVLADDVIRPVDLAVEGGFVYFASEGTVGGKTPGSYGWEPDGALARVPAGGGAVEVVLPDIDARRLIMSQGEVIFASWYYGFIARVAPPR